MKIVYNQQYSGHTWPIGRIQLLGKTDERLEGLQYTQAIVPPTLIKEINLFVSDEETL
jgi:hypothetical protein